MAALASQVLANGDTTPAASAAASRLKRKRWRMERNAALGMLSPDAPRCQLATKTVHCTESNCRELRVISALQEARVQCQCPFYWKSFPAEGYKLVVLAAPNHVYATMSKSHVISAFAGIWSLMILQRCWEQSKLWVAQGGCTGHIEWTAVDLGAARQLRVH